MIKAQAMYDFSAQPGSNELSLNTGDLLTITRQDVGDGWWEGVNQNGEQGLFPETYVQVTSSSAAAGGPPAAPPPPLPQEFQGSSPRHSPTKQSVGPQRSLSAAVPPPTHQQSYVQQSYQSQQSSDNQTTGGDFDDDWSDDDSQTGEHSTTRKSRDSQDSQDDSGGRQRLSSRMSCGQSEDDDGSTTTAPLSVSIDKENGHPTYGADSNATQARAVDNRGGTMKKSMNRFSPFVKSGTESYLLNTAKLSQKSGAETLEIVLTKDGPEWAPTQVYTCQIRSHQKESKLKGLKSFISYQLIPSINNLKVSRRYKHFDWLHGRLQDKYSIIFIPPLPEKQVTGRYEDEFVEHRMHLLQLWLTKICRHPVLSKSEVWMHFLLTTDEKEWKKGKRKAEKDEYCGGLLFFTIKAPPQPLDPNDVDQQTDSFQKCSKMLEDSVRHVQSVAGESAKKMAGPYKRECCKMGNAFRSLAASFDSDPNPKARHLAGAVQSTADCYDTMGKLYEDQPKRDMAPLLNELFIYKGMLSAVPDMVQVQKSAAAKLRDSQKLADEGKLSANELESVRSRVDTINYATLAEINNFQRERLGDFNQLIGNFLHAQIDFYQNIVEKLQQSLRNYES